MSAIVAACLRQQRIRSAFVTTRSVHENEECGGGLCSPTIDSLSVAVGTEAFDATLLAMVERKPHRFSADVERNIVRGIACNGEVAATYTVSNDIARRVMEITSPELLEFHEQKQ